MAARGAPFAVPAMAAGLMLASPSALAVRFSQLMPEWLKQMQTAAGLATAFFVTLGIATVAFGISYLIRHFAESRGGRDSSEWQKGIVAVFAGTCMVILPWVTSLLTETLSVPEADVIVNFKGENPLEQYTQ